MCHICCPNTLPLFIASHSVLRQPHGRRRRRRWRCSTLGTQHGINNCNHECECMTVCECVSEDNGLSASHCLWPLNRQTRAHTLTVSVSLPLLAPSHSANKNIASGFCFHKLHRINSAFNRVCKRQQSSRVAWAPPPSRSPSAPAPPLWLYDVFIYLAGARVCAYV